MIVRDRLAVPGSNNIQGHWFWTGKKLIFRKYYDSEARGPVHQGSYSEVPRKKKVYIQGRMQLLMEKTV
jgi:hypothetical protein